MTGQIDLDEMKQFIEGKNKPEKMPVAMDYGALNDPKIGAKASRAVALFKKGKLPEALELFLEVWDVMPDNRDIQILLAHCLSKLGVRDLAIKVISRVLSGSEPNEEVLSLMYTLAKDMTMYDIAEKIAMQLVAMVPTNSNHYVSLASAMINCDKMDEAIAMLQKVIPSFPTDPELWNILGTTVNFKSGAADSIPFYEEAIRLNPKNHAYYSNMGAAYDRDPIKQEEYFRKAIKLEKTNSEAHVGLGISLIWQGKLKEGFKHYEERHNPRRKLGQAILYGHKLRKWNRKKIKDRTIFVCNEQGVGDELLFAVSLLKLQKLGGKFVIGCDYRFVEAFKRSFPNAVMVGRSVDASVQGYSLRVYPEITNAIKAKELDIDGFIPMGDLCGHLWRDVSDIEVPAAGIIKPDPDEVKKWADRLKDHNGTLKIGISWQSGRIEGNRRHHYLTLDDLRPILEMPNVTIVNLQYGDVADDIERAKKEFGVDIKTWDDLDLKKDLDGNFALMRNLDVVIGPGIATQPMAASVGARTWWLLQHEPWWCFGEDGKVPWTSNGRYFIREGGEHDPTILQVVEELKSLQTELYGDV